VTFSVLFVCIYSITHINLCTLRTGSRCTYCVHGPATGLPLTAAKQCEIISARSHCIPTWAVRYCGRGMASHVSMATDCSCDKTPAAPRRIRVIRLVVVAERNG